ncbi:MAG: extracellular solute-binding protein [bacterium]|nr:extracellular solute-binding protein [bacterium]
MKRFMTTCFVGMLVVSIVVMAGLQPTYAGEKISVWTWKLAYMPGFEAVAEAFTQETGVEVEISPFYPDQTYKQKVAAAMATDTLPDVIHWWGVRDPEFVEQMVNMKKVMTDEWKSSFYPVAFPAVTVDQQSIDEWASDKETLPYKKKLQIGDIAGIPLDVGGFYIFYGNKTLIEKAGLDPTQKPADWDEFVQIIKTVHEKTGVAGLTYGGKFADLWRNWAGVGHIVMANGPEGFAALLKREAKMSAPENLRVLKALETLVNDDLLQPGILNLTIDDADTSFFAGKAAFNLGGSFTMSTLLALGMNADDVVIYALPPLKGGKQMEWKNNPFTLTMMSVKKDAPAGAMEFVKFLTSPEGAALFASGAYTIPAVDLGAAGMGEQLPEALKPIVASFVSEPDYFTQMRTMDGGVDKDWAIGAHKEWQILDSGLQKMVAGKATAEEVAADFDAAMEAEKANE